MAKPLHPDVAAKYTLVGVKPGVYDFADFGRIDLCAMGLAMADRLHKAGASFLRLKPPPPSRKAKRKS